MSSFRNKSIAALTAVNKELRGVNKTALELLRSVLNDYADEGCFECGTISCFTYTRVLEFMEKHDEQG